MAIAIGGRPIVRYFRPRINAVSLAARRRLTTSTTTSTEAIPPRFGFAFDIDGVLLRSSKRLPGAKEALLKLQDLKIPFVLLTNGGGKPESERVKELSELLEVPIGKDIFIQSHTPYAELVNSSNNYRTTKPLENEPILVCGGDGDNCRRAAESYGFKNVIIPSDIFHACPEIWPFSKPFADYHAKAARPLPLPIFRPTEAEPTPMDEKHLRIESMFVYNDPRDMGLDSQIIMDLLLSHRGFLGTRSKLNNTPEITNGGYLQDGQPKLYIANPDLEWAAQFHIPRFGSGGFRAQLHGLWSRLTIGTPNMQEHLNGKPHLLAFKTAEDLLRKSHRHAWRLAEMHTAMFDRIYMIGDNPKSDIQGANRFRAQHWNFPERATWLSYLVRSGVWQGEAPDSIARRPFRIADGVLDAVQKVLDDEHLVASEVDTMSKPSIMNGSAASPAQNYLDEVNRHSSAKDTDDREALQGKQDNAKHITKVRSKDKSQYSFRHILEAKQAG